MEHGLYGIVVISGEGVKEYYEKRGYKDVDTFMIKDFWFYQVWYYYLKKNYYYLSLTTLLTFLSIIIKIFYNKYYM
jgi:hypothetical protein